MDTTHLESYSLDKRTCRGKKVPEGMALACPQREPHMNRGGNTAKAVDVDGNGLSTLSNARTSRAIN
jgi:hypothetical protein